MYNVRWCNIVIRFSIAIFSSLHLYTRKMMGRWTSSLTVCHNQLANHFIIGKLPCTITHFVHHNPHLACSNHIRPIQVHFNFGLFLCFQNSSSFFSQNFVMQISWKTSLFKLHLLISSVLMESTAKIHDREREEMTWARTRLESKTLSNLCFRAWSKKRCFYPNIVTMINNKFRRIFLSVIVTFNRIYIALGRNQSK